MFTKPIDQWPSKNIYKMVINSVSCYLSLIDQICALTQLTFWISDAGENEGYDHYVSIHQCKSVFRITTANISTFIKINRNLYKVHWKLTYVQYNIYKLSVVQWISVTHIVLVSANAMRYFYNYDMNFMIYYEMRKYCMNTDYYNGNLSVDDKILNWIKK